jgi:diguanylate cyclase (GGDEF)-like protein/PAS domain S-box-containing protein
VVACLIYIVLHVIKIECTSFIRVPESMRVLQFKLYLTTWCVGCLLMATGMQADARSQVKLQLKWHHQFQFAGYYAALEKGYYRQENLDVEIIEGGKQRPPVKQLLAGAATYAIGDSDILIDRVAGKPIVAIASTFQHSPYVLLSLREQQIFSPQDLIGKRIMLSNGLGEAQFIAMMNKQGIDMKLLKIVPHTWNLNDLTQGKVDVMSAYASVEPIQLELQGYSPAILSTQKFGVDFYGDILFTTEQEIRTHPERVEAFLRATKKGWNYAFSHPEELADLILKKESVSKNGITHDTLLREAYAMRPYVMSDIVEVGHMNQERWAHIAKTLSDLNMIPKRYVLDGFIYHPKSNMDASAARWLGGLGLALLALIGTVSVWNLQIRRKVRIRTKALQDEVLRREHAEELLKIAGEAARLGGWILELEEQRVLWSDEVAAIHDLPAGYTPSIEEGVSYFVPEHRHIIQKAVHDCIHQGEPYDLELEKITALGRRIWVRTIGQPVRDAYGNIVRLQGAFQDISERKKLEAFKMGQRAILEKIAVDATLSEILHAAVALIEAQFPHCLCSVMLLDHDEMHLADGVSIKLDSRYVAQLHGLTIGARAGSCGTAAYEKRRVVVTDIAQDPLWESYQHLVTDFGLKACWSSPIFSSKQKVLGTFAVYYQTVAGPTDAELELVDALSHLLGIAIERHQSQQHLRLLETGIARLNDIVMITEAEPIDGLGPRILFVNDAFERVTGYSREEVIGKSPRILQGEHTQKEELRKMRQALEAWQPVRSEVINYKKNGEAIWLELDIVPISDDTGWYTHWVAVERDITQRKQAESKIQQLAFYDPMTNLPNRQLLLDRLEQRLASSTRTHHAGAVIFIDLDNFKSLNDTHGHDVGDLLLIEVAQRVVACVRETDTVSRLGGDEFVVIIDELDENLQEAAVQASAVCEKILNSFKKPFHLKQYVHHSSPSIGVTLFNYQQPTTVDELLRRADLAMYKAKSSGRNTYRFFDPQMQAVVNDRVSLEGDLHLGIRYQQFELYYQPQMDSARHVIGAETLIRWHHPDRGLVMPGQFIQLAEDSGLILPIGQWILETACKQLLAWAAQPHTAHLVLAVNVSARQYLQADFAEKLIALLDRTGVDPTKLKLELTESMLVENVEDIIVKMSALKAKGVGFSLDDFGTGYSSLSYLKRLPLDQLKIDQSFVRDVMTDPNDASIVRAIITLGLNLGLDVIAEGVETEAQLQILLANGCKAFQGYLFSKPVPIAQFDSLLNAATLPAN